MKPQRRDAVDTDIDDVFDELTATAKRAIPEVQIGMAVQQSALRTSRWNANELTKQVQKVAKVNIFDDSAGIGQHLDLYVKQNVSLVKSLAFDQLDDLKDIVIRGARAGTHHTEVARQIQQRFGVTKNRAALIATDQIGKLNGELNQLRQQNLGMRRYRWSTSQDERVRHDHAVLNGTIQEWAKPPIIDQRTGQRGHPGQAVRCRCSAIPIIDDVLVDAGLMDPADVELTQPTRGQQPALKPVALPPSPQPPVLPPPPPPVPPTPAATRLPPPGLPLPPPANTLTAEQLLELQRKEERAAKQAAARRARAAAKREEAERARIAAEKAEAERLERERLEREEAERARIAAEQARLERERLEREEAEKRAREAAERERLEREAAEKRAREAEEKRARAAAKKAEAEAKAAAKKAAAEAKAAAKKAAAEAKAAAKKGTTPAAVNEKHSMEYWLPHYADYGKHARRSMAWGRAMKERGLSLPLADLQREYAALQRKGVMVGSRRLDRSVSDLLKNPKIKTVGDAIEHIKSSGDPWGSVRITELEMSSTTVAHTQSIGARAQAALPDVSFDSTDSIGLREKLSDVMSKSRSIYSALASDSVVFPTAARPGMPARPTDYVYRPNRPHDPKPARAFMNPRTREVVFGDAHRDNPRMLADSLHETGHTLEDLNRELLTRANDYVARRTRGERTVKLKDLYPTANYRDDEVCKPDRLFHPYMGKDYGAGATEITSMTVEGAHSHEEMGALYEKDPDSFLFLLGQLANR